MLALPCLVVACTWLCMVPVPLSAGSEPATRLASYFDMDIEDSKQHPWLEYSVWQDQEWVRIYTAGQPQRWHLGETVPDLPDNSFREWQRVTDPNGRTGEHGQAWTGSIRDTSAFCLEWSLSRLIIRMINLLVKFGIPRPFQLRRHSPMLLRFLMVIARLLHNSLQSSMATLVMLNAVISRSRLLSGLGLFLVPLAAVDFLVNDRDTGLSM